MDKKKYFEILRETREKKGIDHKEVYETLRIRPVFLEKIEEGDLEFQHISYIRAFVKSYSDYLRLDVKEILENFDDFASSKNVKQAVSTPEQFQVVEHETVEQETIEDSQKKGKNILRIVLFILALGTLIIISQVWMKDDGEDSSLLSSGEETVASGDTTSLPEKSVINRELGIDRKKPFTLVARGVNDTWIRVVRDVKDTLDLILKPGESASWTALDSFNLKIGNANGIQLYINEDSLGRLGGPRDLVLELTIGREGIINRRLLSRKNPDSPAAGDTLN